MSQWQPPRMREIHKKLRDDFNRVLREGYGFTGLESDPILEVLFRSLAVQIEDVYDQAATAIPLAVLDELMTGLGMPERRAQAAQTVLQFSLKEGRELFEQGTELIAEAKSREKFTFTLDAAVSVTAARICLVAIYQDQNLQLHHGTELPKEFEAARPSFEAVPADLGLNPAIFIAVDVPDPRHLSHHGLYFELIPEAKDLLGHLQREIWCLIDDAGHVRAEGMLRSQIGNAGVRKLKWLASEITDESAVETAPLPEGFYGGRVFIFPEIPTERQFLSKIPHNMKDPLKRMFSANAADVFDRPRAWIRIAMPQEARAIAEDLVRIVLHCTTASNTEVYNQTINFDAEGTVVTVGNGSGRVRHFVKTISIKGQRGAEYVPESEPVADRRAGRYRYRQGCLELIPARTAQGEVDRYANVRLLLSNGRLEGDDSVGARAITAFLNRTTPKGLGFWNLNAAAGGTDEESFEAARQRFAEILMARERLLTHADLESIVKAFEPKVRTVKSVPMLERALEGLRRVQRVTIGLDRRAFTSADEEARILQRDLQTHLQKRALIGLEIQVTIEWV